MNIFETVVVAAAAVMLVSPEIDSCSVSLSPPSVGLGGGEKGAPVGC
jgi:hypothetical protein